MTGAGEGLTRHLSYSVMPGRVLHFWTSATGGHVGAVSELSRCHVRVCAGSCDGLPCLLLTLAFCATAAQAMWSQVHCFRRPWPPSLLFSHHKARHFKLSRCSGASSMGLLPDMPAISLDESVLALLRGPKKRSQPLTLERHTGLAHLLRPVVNPRQIFFC